MTEDTSRGEKGGVSLSLSAPSMGQSHGWVLEAALRLATGKVGLALYLFCFGSAEGGLW